MVYNVLLFGVVLCCWSLKVHNKNIMELFIYDLAFFDMARLEDQNQIPLQTHSNKAKRNGLKGRTRFELYTSSLNLLYK